MLLRVNDTVVVTTGREAGQRGKILKVDRENGRVVVEGLNRVYKHVKKSQRNPQGGRLLKDGTIDVSNVMIICPQTGKPTRIGVRYLADGTKERFAKKSGASLGVLSPPRKPYAKKA